jgi:hypothetical protein
MLERWFMSFERICFLPNTGSGAEVGTGIDFTFFKGFSCTGVSGYKDNNVR